MRLQIIFIQKKLEPKNKRLNIGNKLLYIEKKL